MSASESNTYIATPEEEEEEEYEVEQILDHRKRAGKLQYEIKWKDYSEEDNTWENETNVFATDLVDAYWDSRGGQAALEAARRGKKIKKAKTPDIKEKGKQSRRASSTSSISKVLSPSPSGVKRTRTPDFSLPLPSGSVTSSSLDTIIGPEQLPKRTRAEPVEKESESENNAGSVNTDPQQEPSIIENHTSVPLSPSSSSSLQSQQQQQQQKTATAAPSSSSSSSSSPSSSSSSLQQQSTTTVASPSSEVSKDNQQNLSLSASSKQKDSTLPKSSQTETNTHKENDNGSIQNSETPNNDIPSITTTTEWEADVSDENYEHNGETVIPSLLEKGYVVPCASSSSLSSSINTTNVSVAAIATAAQEPTSIESLTSISPSERQTINQNAENKNTGTMVNEEDEVMDELDEPTSVVSPGTLQDTGMMLDMMDESPFTPTPPPVDKLATAITTSDTANEEQQDVSMETATTGSATSKEKEIEDGSTILRDSDKHPYDNVDIEQDPVASKFARREKYMKGMDEINEDDVIYDDHFPANQDDWVNVKEVVAVTEVPRGSPDSEVFAVVRWENNILSMHPSQDIRKYCPHQLIEFYEKSIKFIV